jgi:hypothetical protein
MSDPINVTVTAPAAISSTPATPATNTSQVNAAAQATPFGQITGQPTDNAALTTVLNGKQKTITAGTTAPTGGVDGDIYLQYT